VVLNNEQKYYVKDKLLKNSKFSYYRMKNDTAIIYINKNHLGIQGQCNLNRLNSDDIALLEYLERMCSFIEGGELHSKESVPPNKIINLNKINHFWDDRQEKSSLENLNFILGSSLYSKKDVYVPASIPYYLSLDDSEMFSGSSNGSAVGKTLEDATYRALLEFIERDTFLKFWYGDTCRGKLLSSSRNGIVSLLKKLMLIENYLVDFVVIEQFKGIYTVWCIARSFNYSSPIYSMSGLACSGKLFTAVKRSFDEMYGTLKLRIDKITNKTDKTIRLNDDLDKIINYFSSYKVKEKVEEMLYSLEQKSADDFKSSDLLTLDVLIKESKKIYSDVIVVDITSKILEDIDFKCVKVVVENGWDMIFNEKENYVGLKYQPIA